MTAAIDVAEAALNLKTGLENVSAPPKTANLQGRPVDHWSYKVQIGGAIIGVISLVAFWILNMVPAAIVSGVLLATNLFAAYFLHKFRQFDQLEDYVKDMAGRIHEFSDRIQELKEANKSLEHIDKDMEVIPHHWHVEIEKGKKELLDVHTKFEALKRNYDAVLLKLSKFSTISKTLQDEAGSLAQETIKFGGENKSLAENIQRITDGLQVFQKHNSDISDRNKELDQANKEFDRLEGEFNKTVEMISKLFEAIKDVYKKNSEMLAIFDKKITEIKGVAPDKASHEEMQNLNAQIIKLQAQVESLLKKEQELKELRAFKDVNKVAFEAWKKTNGRGLK